MPLVQPTTPRSIHAEAAPIKPEDFGTRQARHLLNRAGFGGTPEQIATLAEWGPEKSVDYLLDPEAVPFRADSDAPVRSDVIPTYSPEQRRARRDVFQSGDAAAIAKLRQADQRARAQDRRQFAQLRSWWLERMIESPRPLEEKMTLFWHGHFASSYRKVQHAWNMYRQNALFRKHAVGSYAHLLAAIIRDPAMIRYLDNHNSTKRDPNENLARELMELFSLGEGNYSERDIKEGARALTGYSFNGPDFEFRKGVHDSGSKSILGSRGQLNGEGFVAAILRRPDCARFMTDKLYRFFVRPLDTEPDRQQREFLRRITTTFRTSRYQMKPVLRQILLSNHFYDDASMNAQIKSPVELLVGAVRSLRLPARDLDTLTGALEQMGQNLFMPPSVEGWPGGRAWISTSTLFSRQNTLAFLLTGRETSDNEDAMMAMKPDENEAFDDSRLRFSARPLGGPEAGTFDPTTVLSSIDARGLEKASNGEPLLAARQLLEFTLGDSPTTAERSLSEIFRQRGVHGGITDALLLITALPEFQLC